jgi:hypothetical protein
MVATDEEKQAFSYLLSKKVSHQISDHHLWYSIFSHPAASRFTRVQRCTCCFVFLFLSMFLNILYYDRTNASAAANSTIQLGPIALSLQQVIITHHSCIDIFTFDLIRSSWVSSSNYSCCCQACWLCNSSVEHDRVNQHRAHPTNDQHRCDCRGGACLSAMDYVWHWWLCRSSFSSFVASSSAMKKHNNGSCRCCVVSSLRFSSFNRSR